MGKKKKNKDAVAQKQRRVDAAPTAEDSVNKKARNSKILILLSLVLLGAVTVFLLMKIAARNNKITAGEYKGYNVLLITLDTTRADHLPVYGYKEVQTPQLDKLAQESFVFEDAVSQVPLTLASHSTMLTGKLPIGHGVRDNSGFYLDDKETTIPEVLKQKGYSTAAFVSSFVLDSRWNLDQGFDEYFDNFNLALFKGLNPREAQRHAGETEEEVSEWLDAHHTKPFFLWVHFYDPHDPYDPPEPYKSKYADHLYDGEIAYMDENIGKLLSKLKNLQIKDRTIIFVAGDHGEGLGQHEESTHAMFVYSSTLHVPLMIHLPGIKKQRIPGVVRLMDLAPTVYEMLGLTPPAGIQGKTLVPLMNGTEQSKRIAYSESSYAEFHYGWSPLKSVTTNQYKFIEAPRAELYDRIKDPNEQNNIINEKPSIAKVLKGDLQEIIAQNSRKDLNGPQQMDPETEERLRSLGYVGGTVKSTAESRKVDPKDRIQMMKAIQEASLASTNGPEYETALRLILPVLKQDPNIVDAHFIAGVSYVGLGKYDQGLDELYKTIALNPNHAMALYNIAYAFQQQGNLKEAEKWYLKVLNHEEKLYASLGLAHLYMDMGEPEKAKKYFILTAKSYEEFAEATKEKKAKSALYDTLGEIYFGAGELDLAVKNYKLAIELTPDKPSLHYNLAEIYEAKGDVQSAFSAYKEEIDVAPGNYKAFNNLGLLYKQNGSWDEAAACFQKVIELLPQSPNGYVLLASVYKKQGRDTDAERLLQQVRGKGAKSKE
jgi:arylsulfatase A-like enzyme/tetratricopeptide (TPR) repeat protein